MVQIAKPWDQKNGKTEGLSFLLEACMFSVGDMSGSGWVMHIEFTGLLAPARLADALQF